MKNKRPTQADRLLVYLDSHVGITQLQATELFGITRLSGRIFELKEAGYPIISVWKEVKNRYGEVTRVKEYRLCKA